MKSVSVVLENRRAAAVLVACLACLVYANAVANDFAYDDFHIIVNHSEIQALETLPGAVASPYWPGMFGRELGLWRPTTQLAFGLQWIVSDGSSTLFHLVNIK